MPCSICRSHSVTSDKNKCGHCGQMICHSCFEDHKKYVLEKLTKSIAECEKKREQEEVSWQSYESSTASKINTMKEKTEKSIEDLVQLSTKRYERLLMQKDEYSKIISNVEDDIEKLTEQCKISEDSQLLQEYIDKSRDELEKFKSKVKDLEASADEFVKWLESVEEQVMCAVTEEEKNLVGKRENAAKVAVDTTEKTEKIKVVADEEVEKVSEKMQRLEFSSEEQEKVEEQSTASEDEDVAQESVLSCESASLSDSGSSAAHSSVTSMDVEVLKHRHSKIQFTGSEGRLAQFYAGKLIYPTDRVITENKKNEINNKAFSDVHFLLFSSEREVFEGGGMRKDVVNMLFSRVNYYFNDLSVYGNCFSDEAMNAYLAIGREYYIIWQNKDKEYSFFMKHSCYNNDPFLEDMKIADNGKLAHKFLRTRGGCYELVSSDSSVKMSAEALPFAILKEVPEIRRLKYMLENNFRLTNSDKKYMSDTLSFLLPGLRKYGSKLPLNVRDVCFSILKNLLKCMHYHTCRAGGVIGGTSVASARLPETSQEPTSGDKIPQVSEPVRALFEDKMCQKVVNSIVRGSTLPIQVLPSLQKYISSIDGIRGGHQSKVSLPEKAILERLRNMCLFVKLNRIYRITRSRREDVVEFLDFVVNTVSELRIDATLDKLKEGSIKKKDQRYMQKVVEAKGRCDNSRSNLYFTEDEDHLLQVKLDTAIRKIYGIFKCYYNFTPGKPYPYVDKTDAGFLLLDWFKSQCDDDVDPTELVYKLLKSDAIWNAMCICDTSVRISIDITLSKMRDKSLKTLKVGVSNVFGVQ